MGAEFLEFMELEDFNGQPLERKKFREKFNENYRTIAKYNTPQKFNTKVRKYCDYHNLPFDEKPYNGSVCFYIGTPEDDINDEAPF